MKLKRGEALRDAAGLVPSSFSVSANLQVSLCSHHDPTPQAQTQRAFTWLPTLQRCECAQS